MDDEFDDSLDAICTQVQIDFDKNETENDLKKNEFKIPEAPSRPLYSFNRIQQNRATDQTCDNSNLNSNLSNQTNKSYSTNNKLNSFNKSHQPFITNQLNNQKPPNQNKLNQENVKYQSTSRSNSFTKPFISVNQLITNKSSIGLGNAGFSNLAKSVIAQNQGCKYSVNKQNLTISNNHSNVQRSFGKPIKQINSCFSATSSNQSTQSNNNQTSVIFSSQKSQNANHSSFEISDNVTADFSVKPTLKALDLNPEDKYIGEIQMLKTQIKKKDEKIVQLEELISEKEKEAAKKLKIYERKIEEMKSELDFNDSRIISDGFKEILSTKIAKTSCNFNENTSDFKLPSPLKTKIHQSNESIKVPKFNINNISMFDDDNFIIPETQFSTNHNQHSNDLSVIPPTQTDNLTDNLKSKDFSVTESDEEDIVPASQFADMIIPETQIQKTKSKDISDRKQERIELKRIKIESSKASLLPEEKFISCHELHFKFIDFQVYDNLFNEKRINYIRENINPNFDKIIEKIINLQLYNQFSKYEFKFSKLNEDFIIDLLYLDLRTNIPELMFNLLINLHEYTMYLQDKELFSKLTNKCVVWKEKNKSKVADSDGRTLFSRMATILSYRFLGEDKDNSKDYLRLYHSIIIFLNENTVERNSISQFHNLNKCECWIELYNVLGQFALYLMDIYEQNNKLHQLIVKDLIKFILNLNRSETKVKGINNYISYFAQKMPSNYFKYLNLSCLI